MTYDVAIVGSGILGLAHALAAAKRGLKVIVVERSPAPQGASVRNFGMVWPIGQTPGPNLRLALESKAVWQAVVREAGLWADPCGSLHIAQNQIESDVLHEFVQFAPQNGYSVEFLNPQDLKAIAPHLHHDRIVAAMFSHTEMCVDPRQALRRIPKYLHQDLAVEFSFETCAIEAKSGLLQTSRGTIAARHIYICSGEDFVTLFPEVYGQSGMVKCKLQMLRAEHQDPEWKLGTMLCGGLTLTHYAAFQNCPSLPLLKEHYAQNMPEIVRWGIHVMASQHGTGEITIGDSHEYGPTPLPFNREEVDQLILDYLETFLQTKGLRITEKWNGVYAKHPTETFQRFHPETGVEIVTSPGGAGMTLSFGVGEQSLNQLQQTTPAPSSNATSG